MNMQSKYIIYDSKWAQYLRYQARRTFTVSGAPELFDSIEDAQQVLNRIVNWGYILNESPFPFKELYVSGIKLEIRSCRLKANNKLCIGSKNYS